MKIKKQQARFTKMDTSAADDKSVAIWNEFFNVFFCGTKICLCEVPSKMIFYKTGIIANGGGCDP